MSFADTNGERLLRLADVPGLDWLPRRHGRPINQATIYRWAQRGLIGKAGRRIRLETIRCGGGQAVSEAALMRFFQRLSAEAGEETGTATASAGRSHTAAAAALEVAGW